MSAAEKGNWTEMKKHLSSKFDNPQERMKFISSVDAYQRNPSDSLPIYRAEVVRLVKKHYKSMKETDDSFKEQIYIRFMKGLPTTYQKAIKLGIKTGHENIDDAYDIAMRYEASLDSVRFEQDQSNIGAAAALQEAPTTAAAFDDNPRIKKLEMDVATLNTNVNELISSIKQLSVNDEKPTRSRSSNSQFSSRQRFNPQRSYSRGRDRSGSRYRRSYSAGSDDSDRESRRNLKYGRRDERYDRKKSFDRRDRYRRKYSDSESSESSSERRERKKKEKKKARRRHISTSSDSQSEPDSSSGPESEKAKKKKKQKEEGND